MIEDMAERIHWLGHDAFRIDAGKTFYFDPYRISSGPSADLIMISHDHFDHCSPEDVAKIQGPGTTIITEKDSARKLSGDVRVLKPGDALEVHGVKVEAVPAYNVDKVFHPRKKGWLGFVLELEGLRIYHAGDCDVMPEMQSLQVDIAMLPVSGTFVMTADQAVKAALAIGPKCAIPMHYGAIVGGDEDALYFKRALEGKINVFLLPKE